MVKFKIPIKDLLGRAYYRYELISTHYNTTPSQTGITITCTCKNIFGNPVANKELTLYHQNSIQGTATTNANGIATWTVSNLNTGNQIFWVEDATIIIYIKGWESKSVANGYGTLYINRDLRICELRYDREFNGASADTFYTWHNGAIEQQYRPSSQVDGSFNQVGSLYVSYEGNIGGKFANGWSGNRHCIGTVMWHY